ncbi:MAG: ABC transporter permease [Candidatus Thermoplasmatota archaeon]|jgi:ABC-type lipoprotein release transport system permease subunit|nr:ABC transporter permease [Candidatus Thermoplasmatota archaeon]
MLLSDPRHFKLRTAVIVLAIAASVSLSTVLSSLSLGLSGSTRSSLDKVRSDIYVVPKDLNPLLLDLQRFDQGHMVLEELSASPFPPERAAPRLSDTIFMVIGNNGLDEVSVIGVDPFTEPYFGQFRTVKGSWFTTLDDEVLESYKVNGSADRASFSYELLISERLSREGGLGPGDRVSMTPSASTPDALSYVIVGTFVNELSRLDRSIIIKLGELQYMRGGLKRDSMTEVLLSFAGKDMADGAVRWASSDEFLFRDIVDLTSKEEILSEVGEFTALVDAFSAIVVISTAIVCLFFTSTLFSISARRQARVLATVRAIGIPLLRLISMIIYESMAFFMAGTILGIAASFVLVLALDDMMVDRMQVLPSSFHLFVLDPILLLGIVGAALVLSLLSGLVPAILSSMRVPTRELQGGSD